MIVYHIDELGGFTCGDMATGHTAYAYPSSKNATDAKRDPNQVAVVMMRQANYLNPLLSGDIVSHANQRNWTTLNVDDSDRPGEGPAEGFDVCGLTIN